MAEPVRFEKRGALAIITIDDQATRNALGPKTANLLARYAEESAEDETIRLLVLTGADGVFCSGAAMRDWEQEPDAGETLTDTGTELCELIEDLPIPVVACLPGHAVGGGAELALAADWRVMDPAAELRFVHTGFGLIPGFGGLTRLELLVGRAKTLMLMATRARVNAEDALTLGLCEAVVPAAEQLDWAVDLAAAMAQSDRAAISAIKQAISTGDERTAFLSVWPDRQLPDRLGS